jgi:hypothetical protein
VSDGVKRVAAAAGLGLAWFVVVGVGGVLGGHDVKTEVAIIVFALIVGPFLGIALMMAATEEAGLFSAAALWIAWVLAGVLGVLAMFGAAEAYEWSYGHPQAVMVMDTRCVPDSDGTDCAPEVRVSTMDTERDLGWLGDCGPRLGRGQRAVVLTDPRGWFQPQVTSCARDGRWLGPVIAGSVGFAAVLTVTHLCWAFAFAPRERRQVRRWAR